MKNWEIFAAKESPKWMKVVNVHVMRIKKRDLFQRRPKIHDRSSELQKLHYNRRAICARFPSRSGCVVHGVWPFVDTLWPSSSSSARHGFNWLLSISNGQLSWRGYLGRTVLLQKCYAGTTLCLFCSFCSQCVQCQWQHLFFRVAPTGQKQAGTPKLRPFVEITTIKLNAVITAKWP
jgi:hypothetical protein